MINLRRIPVSLRWAIASLGAAAVIAATPGAPVPAQLLSGLAWRNVGPFRGGRVSAASGVIGEVGTFYVGMAGGGVWKTTSAGQTWFPIFDSVHNASAIGALDVAPSNPNIIYVGTGQIFGGAGDGVYKSTDAGKTWKHVGLDSVVRINGLIVDPRNPDVALVGAVGGPIKGPYRGVYRTTDGGATWSRTLYTSDSAGVSSMARAFDRPDVVFATLRRTGFPPVPASGINPPPPPPVRNPEPAGGVFKSVDGGVTWTQLKGGLPPISNITSIAVAMNTNAQRVYLETNVNFYRSDDGGTTWKQMDSTDRRVRNGQGGYNSGVFVDPKNPDIVYTFNTSSYKSTDGGNTFTGFRGAPGGDDAQVGWIDPTNPDRILFGFDQGAIVSLDHGATWSSWYNQSNEQVYHISVDNSFPYWIYASQQDAGAVRTRARGDLGAVTPFDWSGVNAWEWGTIVPDPKDANTVFATGIDVLKLNMATGQHISVSPANNPNLKLRLSFSQPLVWAPWDSRELFAGFQKVMATTDGGAHWKAISPDLTYTPGVTPFPDSVKPGPGVPPPGAIETMSASPIARGTIWVGTSNGLIKVTKDEGKSWSDATIPNLPYPPIVLIEKVEASPFNGAEAYAAVNASGPGDDRPYLYRTRDYGKTWQKITDGLAADWPTGGSVRVVRADPKQAGLLFAGTESGMHVSFDDGDHWQSLQLNLPNTSYRDIAFAGNDLIVGTYGRGIWVLDDYAVLRQMTPDIAREPVHLFKPDPAVRVRRNTGYNTPLPLDVPKAENPPDGAIIDYWLASRPTAPVTIEVLDASGAVVRHMSSVAEAPVREAAQPPHPNFWVAEPFRLPANAGTNRTNWDLRYDAPPAFVHTFEINANPGRTPASPEGMLALPGTYTIRLTVNGKSYSAPLTVTNDPRSPATPADLAAQHALIEKIDAGMHTAWDGYWQADSMRDALAKVKAADSTSDLAKMVKEFQAKLDSIAGEAQDSRPFSFGFQGRPRTDLFNVHSRLQDQFMNQENGDLAPPEPVLQGFALMCTDLATTVARWKTLNGAELNALNALITKAGQQAIPAAAGIPAPRC